MPAHTDFVVVSRGAMTADNYLLLIPVAPLIDDGFMLMHENTLSHISVIVNDYLNEVEIYQRYII